jgi:hypothetical protein
MASLIKDFLIEYERYRILGQKAIDQVPDEALNRVVATDGNSIATLVRHISGNLLSRFTDFLTSDGEKPWRNRDSEFEDPNYDRRRLQEDWDKGWRVVEDQLNALSDQDLSRDIQIRGVSLTVHEALCRSAAHAAYHVGQIVFLSRMLVEQDWKWLSIPKGQSSAYNLSPTLEKKPE